MWLRSFAQIREIERFTGTLGFSSRTGVLRLLVHLDDWRVSTAGPLRPCAPVCARVHSMRGLKCLTGDWAETG